MAVDRPDVTADLVRGDRKGIRTAPHAGRNFDRAGAVRLLEWAPGSRTDPFLARSCASTFADAVVAHIDTVTEALLTESQVRQPVHGDFCDNNVLFADDDLVAVIDFDFMAARHRTDDPALPIWFFLLEPGRGLPAADDRELVRGLIDAYN